MKVIFSSFPKQPRVLESIPASSGERSPGQAADKKNPLFLARLMKSLNKELIKLSAVCRNGSKGKEESHNPFISPL